MNCYAKKSNFWGSHQHDFSTKSLISELNYFFDGLKAENKGNRKNQVRLEGEENE